MQYQKFGTKYLLRLDKGEEITHSLTEFCQKENITLGSINGLGATNKVELGLFDIEKKEYFSQTFTGNFEICPLHGNISTMNNKIYLHLHANIADSDQRSYGGHLNTAIISATFEGMIDVFHGKVDRELDEEIGLNLIKFKK